MANRLAPDYPALVRCAVAKDRERAHELVRKGCVELHPREQGRGLYGVVVPEQLAALVVAVDDVVVWTCACGSSGSVPARPCVHAVAVVRAWLADEETARIRQPLERGNV